MDYVLPMAYRTNLDELRAVLSALRALLAGRAAGRERAVYPGLAVWVSPAEIVRQVELVRELGFEGVTLFSTVNLTADHYRALEKSLG